MPDFVLFVLCVAALLVCVGFFIEDAWRWWAIPICVFASLTTWFVVYAYQPNTINKQIVSDIETITYKDGSKEQFFTDENGVRVSVQSKFRGFFPDDKTTVVITIYNRWYLGVYRSISDKYELRNK